DPAVVRRLTPRIADAIAPIGQPSQKLPRELERLTAREHEVFLLVAKGFTNREIGRSLYIGDETVKTHVSRIFMKLGLHHRANAVRYAHQHGIIRLGDEQDAGVQSGNSADEW
ncbi:MAG: response regulator transcription factor, partial [Propionibacteriaceae bacterium]|nr:response regulator transcription factor [Propionibacteriaceae bacterium]